MCMNYVHVNYEAVLSVQYFGYYDTVMESRHFSEMETLAKTGVET